jgi:hypothetical protein
MNIWIITTGSSDVQLKTDKNWGTLHGKIRNQLETHKQFSASKSQDGQRFLYPARAMGVVYGQVIEQHYDDLAFPLLDNFWNLLRSKEITPQRIIVLVTNQVENFSPAKKNQVVSPYWQDTCTLEPILRHYFAQQESVTPEFLTLEPESQTSGLDNWNDVLTVVQKELASLTDIPKDATIYVSHQAGTPAISSAVQFCSLAQFGDRVKFLVSNEQDKTLTDTVESSTYLQGIEIQQVSKLLHWHDYAGMKEVLKRQIEEVDKQKDNPKRTDKQRKRDKQLKHVSYLLDAAIHWNCANFESFAEELKKHPDQEFVQIVEERTKVIGEQPQKQQKGKKQNYCNYWWTAYEDAYLGVIRLNQNNTVEAMFHSFRAVEGLLSEWINKHYKHLIKDGEIHLPKPIKVKKRKKEEEITTAKPYGQGLYFALDSIKDISKADDLDIWIFGNCTFGHRNALFHGLEGLADKKEVFRKWQPDNDEKRWGENDGEKWKTRVRNCLNFVAKDDLTKEFESLEEASLMVRVHEELKEAIAQL